MANWDIKRDFVDYTRQKYTGYIYLKCEANALNQQASYPLKWKGLINDNKIEFVQTTMDVVSINDFIWEIFPDNYSSIKIDILKWIDEYQNAMN